MHEKMKERSREIRESLGAGHAAGIDRAARRRRDQAGLFRWDARMERILGLKTSDPTAYSKLPATVKMGLGHYLTSKRAAELEGIDTSAPTDRQGE